MYLGPTQPPVQRVAHLVSPEIQRPGCEADHSPPSSDEVISCDGLNMQLGRSKK